jgi:hypothetical protein
MQNKDSFVLYTKYIDTFKELTDEQAGKLIKVILEYVNDMNPEPEGLIKIAFIPIKQQLKEDLVKWKEEKEKRSLAGKKGMESRYSSVNKELTNDNNVNKCYNKSNNVRNELTNLTDNVNVYVNDNVLNNNNNIITNNSITNNIIISVELPLIDNTLYQISEDKVKEWQQVYQAIDVKNELEKMRCWLNANPKNRKTRKGVERFIVAWLNRSQDKAPRIVHQQAVIEEEQLPQEHIEAVDEDTINQFRELLGG